MFLYNLTLQKSTGITHAIHGNFSGNKHQEICISRGKVIEILRHDVNTGKVHTLLTSEVFGVIRSLAPFRLTGGNKDYIVVGSDSGRIAIIEFNQNNNTLKKVHMETFGKTGCRRLVPGQYMAVDPKGRAVMIGAIEKQKLVYIMNRDSQARLTISSPLEAHKSSTLVFHIVGLDVGFENPTFACLEMDYEEADSDHTGEAAQTTRQMLTYYELDLGLNHVVRKYYEYLDEPANFLISVPGGNEGPSGVLICSENYITYRNFGDQPDIKCPIPRRRNDLDDPERSVIFVTSATHKTKQLFFFLAQTEQGDVFKITIQTDEDMVTEIRLKYFDTIPVASSLCVLKTGFLFVACEFGNHYLYQISHLGDDDDEPEYSSAMPLDEGDTFFYQPRGLKNLMQVDELESLSPIMSCKIADLANEDTPQIYTVCGKGPRSTLRVLRHGLEVSEMAVSELPGNPNAVWTVKKNVTDVYDSYIVVSFVNATLVLSIGETVEEVTDSGFLGTTPTLNCGSIGDDLVQIYPDGIRHIRSDKRVNEWKSPHNRSIVKCAINQRQVVIALTGGEIVYFEMDPTGQLNEYTERKDLGSNVLCMALGQIYPGEQRSHFLAVGLDDGTVRIISLEPSDCLSPLSMQALPAHPESLCILEMGSGSSGVEEAKRNSSLGLFLNIGLQNGVLLRTVLDTVTGDLSDTRTRYLGSRPVKLFRVNIQKNDAVLALSSRSWLCYGYQSRFHLTPLSYDSLEFSSSFGSEQCPEGVVAIASNTLRIISLEKLGSTFNQVATSLKYTPRKFAIHPGTQFLIIIETDQNTYTDEMKLLRKQQIAQEMVEAATDSEEQQMAAEMAAMFLKEELPDDVFGSPKAGSSMSASIIRLINPISGKTLYEVPLDQNIAAYSLVVTKFASRSADEEFLIVGVAKDIIISQNMMNATPPTGEILTYKIINNPKTGNPIFEFLHKTIVEHPVYTMIAFQGRLLVGVGKYLRVYDMGKKKLLRKCENKSFTNTIVTLNSMNNRIVACDIQESFHFLRYRRTENQLVVFADDTIPRWIVCTTMLDYNTVAGADKFGNIVVVRLPQDTNDDVDEDPTGTKTLWDRGMLNGASQKAETIVNFHVGEVVTSLQRSTLIAGGAESLVYTTISGSVGLLVPFTSHEDHDFFQHLEMHIRSEMPPLCGRDHLSYRSYYAPVKNAIDGDLCEMYNCLDVEKQKMIANELDRLPFEIAKKLEDTRTRYAF